MQKNGRLVSSQGLCDLYGGYYTLCLSVFVSMCVSTRLRICVCVRLSVYVVCVV